MPLIALLQDGLADRLSPVFGPHLHRWRHYALLYLTTAYPMSVENAARLIHMDPQTANSIYNNPSVQQLVARLADRINTLASDELERELAQAREKIKFLSGRVRQLEHHLSYLASIFSPLPVPPTPAPMILEPLPAPALPARRRRASPRGGDAFAA